MKLEFPLGLGEQNKKVRIIFLNGPNKHLNTKDTQNFTHKKILTYSKREKKEERKRK